MPFGDIAPANYKPIKLKTCAEMQKMLDALEAAGYRVARCPECDRSDKREACLIPMPDAVHL